MAVIGIGNNPANDIVNNYRQVIKNAPPIKIELPNAPSSVTVRQSNGNISIHV